MSSIAAGLVLVFFIWRIVENCLRFLEADYVAPSILVRLLLVPFEYQLHQVLEYADYALVFN